MDNTWHAVKQIGLDVIKMMVPGKKTYIGQLECLAAAAAIYSLPADRLRGMDAMMWIDNLSAKYGFNRRIQKYQILGGSLMRSRSNKQRYVCEFISSTFLPSRIWHIYLREAI